MPFYLEKLSNLKIIDSVYQIYQQWMQMAELWNFPDQPKINSIVALLAWTNSGNKKLSKI